MAYFSAGWVCRVCGERKIIRAEKWGFMISVAHYLWQVENQAHEKAHIVAGIVKQQGVNNVG